MFLCQKCHGNFDCMGLPSYGPCECCHLTTTTTDCHCPPKKENPMIDPKDPTAKSDAAIRSVLDLKADLATARKTVKSLEGQLAAVKAALRDAPPRRAKKRELTPEAEKKRGPRRGLPTTPPTPAPGG